MAYRTRIAPPLSQRSASELSLVVDHFTMMYLENKAARDAQYALTGDEDDYNRLQGPVDAARAMMLKATRDRDAAHRREVARYESQYGIEY
jgi:hypothetical protein